MSINNGIRKGNIILTGFMGSGKTSVGRRIAELSDVSELPFRFIDTDDEIVKKAEMTIPHIFQHYGEYYFRELESRVAKEASALKNCVVATGGGIVVNEYNIGCLKSSGVCYYLKATTEQIYKNTENDTNRPLLNVEDRREQIGRLLAAREPLYLRYSDMVIETTGLSIDEIARIVWEHWRERH